MQATDKLLVEQSVNQNCPWSGKPVAADSLTEYRGAVVGFCNPGCKEKFVSAISLFDSCIAEGAASARED